MQAELAQEHKQTRGSKNDLIGQQQQQQAGQQTQQPNLIHGSSPESTAHQQEQQHQQGQEPQTAMHMHGGCSGVDDGQEALKLPAADVRGLTSWSDRERVLRLLLARIAGSCGATMLRSATTTANDGGMGGPVQQRAARDRALPVPPPGPQQQQDASHTGTAVTAAAAGAAVDVRGLGEVRARLERSLLSVDKV